MSSHSKKMNRRSLLKAAGVTGIVSAFDPVTLIGSLLKQRSSGKAFAQGQNQSRYIAITSAGAPPRWVFDLLLNHNNSADFRSNPQMGTRYKATNNVYTDVEYVLERIGSHWLPPLWNFNLPGPGNINNRKLSSLLQHMTHFRGIDTNNAGHDFCQRLHFVTASATQSLPALVGDRSNVPIPAINAAAAGYSYMSTASRTAISLTSGGNYITEVLAPFSRPTGLSQGMTNTLNNTTSEMAAAQSALDAEIGANKPEYRAVAEARNSARQLMQSQFPNFDTEWTTLLNKYQDLITRALNATYPGINDRQIGIAPAARDKTYDINDKICAETDIRTIIQATTNVGQLARGFALTEFILKNDLSRSIAFNHGGLVGLANPPSTSSPMDEHFTGKMTSLLINTLLFAALGSCLLELVEVCKGLGIWDKTAIDVAGEFNRSPKQNGTGADHGFRGASVALYSGSITAGPFVLGNIRADGTVGNGSQYIGTWGSGAPVPSLGGVPLSMAHFAASLATILQTQSPVTAVASLLELRNGTIRPLASYNNGIIVK